MRFYQNLSPTIKIFIGILLLGYMLKFQSWSFSHYSSYIVIGSLASIILISIVELISKKKKELNDYLTTIYIISFCAYMIFRIQHYPYRLPFLIVATAAFLFQFIRNQFSEKKVEGKIEHFEEEENEKKEPFIVILMRNIGAFAIVIGAIFKILHFAGADIIMIAGLVLMPLSFAYHLFKK